MTNIEKMRAELAEARAKITRLTARGFEDLTAENEALRAEKQDRDDDRDATLSEVCDGDATVLHCTCVPDLRAEITRLCAGDERVDGGGAQAGSTS